MEMPCIKNDIKKRATDKNEGKLQNIWILLIGTLQNSYPPSFRIPLIPQNCQ